MPETPVKVWGSIVTFSGTPVGRIKEIGDETETRDRIEFLTCDSTTEDKERITGGKDPGELPLTLMFEPSNIGNYNVLKTAYDAGTSATLTVAYGTGGANKSGTASIANLGSPHGNAEGLFEVSVTFLRSGSQVYTSDT